MMCWENKCPDCRGELVESKAVDEVKQNYFECCECKNIYNYRFIMGLNLGYEIAIKDYMKEVGAIK